MSARPNLTNEQLEQIKRYFEDYKTTKLAVRDFAIKLNLNKTTIQKRLQRMFGEEYTKIAKQRSVHNRKLSDEEVRYIFERYRGGEFIVDLAKEYGVRGDSITPRLRKIIGPEYTKLARIRRVKDASVNRQKVTEKDVDIAFCTYKNNKIPLVKIAANLGIQENSLISRFNKRFGKDYKKITKQRRDERKITNEQYTQAFNKYCNSDASLVQLSTELHIQLSSLASKFRRLFGQKYRDIASKKMELIEANRKGKIAEQIAQEYLRKLGIRFEDVRRQHSLEDSPNKPDFISGNTFIEVKNYYVSLAL